MICKWCGAGIRATDRVCSRCGREMPPLSDCGGFYDLVPLARETPPPEEAPRSVEPTTEAQERQPVMPRPPVEDRPENPACPRPVRHRKKPTYFGIRLAAWLLILLLSFSATLRGCSLSRQLDEANDQISRLQDQLRRKENSQEDMTSPAQDPIPAETTAQEETTAPLAPSESIPPKELEKQEEILISVDEDGDFDMIDDSHWQLAESEDDWLALLDRDQTLVKLRYLNQLGSWGIEIASEENAEYRWAWQYSTGDDLDDNWQTFSEEENKPTTLRPEGHENDPVRCVLIWNTQEGREYRIVFTREETAKPNDLKMQN